MRICDIRCGNLPDAAWIVTDDRLSMKGYPMLQTVDFAEMHGGSVFADPETLRVYRVVSVRLSNREGERRDGSRWVTLADAKGDPTPSVGWVPDSLQVIRWRNDDVDNPYAIWRRVSTDMRAAGHPRAVRARYIKSMV